jgi:hypothetical protein
MKGPKIVTGVGCVFSALSALALVVSLVLPVATHGRTSWDEAMLGIIPGAICTGISAVILLGGLAWLFVSRKKA